MFDRVVGERDGRNIAIIFGGCVLAIVAAGFLIKWMLRDAILGAEDDDDDDYILRFDVQLLD